MLNECHFGNCLDVLPRLRDEGLRVQTVVTSPPYWGLRDFGGNRQLGLERTPARYLARMRSVFRLVWDLLEAAGTVWLNMGDSYVSNEAHGMKPKDLVGMPWMLALLLRADRWFLRSDIVWEKPNPMPESTKDRPTRSHEYLFLLTKNSRYYYDADAIKEPASPNTHSRGHGVNPKSKPVTGWDTGPGSHREKLGRYPNPKPKQNESFSAAMSGTVDERNKRSVWTVPTQPYPEAHFATFPEKLIEPCILAGSGPGDVVFDPFLGSGTTAQVAQRLGRDWVGCELNPEYAVMQKQRIAQMGMAI